MEPCSFEQENTILNPPDNLTLDQCGVLPVCKGYIALEHPDIVHPVVISCWKPTRDELEKISKTGRVWLIVLGESMLPAILTGDSPFE